MWVTDATSNQLKKIGPYVFDTAGLADQEAALVDFVKADNPGKKDLKIAGLFPNNPIGQDNDSVSRDRAKQLGLTWVHSMLYPVGATDYRAELQALIDSKPDAILTDVYDSDAQVQQRQLFEMGFTDLSKFYGYNPGAYATLDAKLKDGIKGLDYVTAGPRADAFTKKYIAKYGKLLASLGAAILRRGVDRCRCDQPCPQPRFREDPRRDVARRLSLPRNFRTRRQRSQHVWQAGGRSDLRPCLQGWQTRVYRPPGGTADSSSSATPGRKGCHSTRHRPRKTSRSCIRASRRGAGASVGRESRDGLLRRVPSTPGVLECAAQSSRIRTARRVHHRQEGSSRSAVAPRGRSATAGFPEAERRSGACRLPRVAMNIAQIIVSSLITAAELGIIAIGLTMTFSILRFANFAHASMAVIGAYIGVALQRPAWAGRYGSPFWFRC